ncbi:hypothetical protein [Streptomyces sp. NPDC049040]|uniref:hypothetical protein n=1 Tax=Streptomyces sp. NPDC049040 TaxID=3365593 RepID=UPI0037123CCB
MGDRRCGALRQLGSPAFLVYGYGYVYGYGEGQARLSGEVHFGARFVLPLRCVTACSVRYGDHRARSNRKLFAPEPEACRRVSPWAYKKLGEALAG